MSSEDIKYMQKRVSSALEALDKVVANFKQHIEDAKEAIRATLPKIEAGEFQSAGYVITSVNTDLRYYLVGCYGRTGLDTTTDGIIYGLVSSLNRRSLFQQQKVS